MLINIPWYRESGCGTPSFNYLTLTLGFLALEQSFEWYLSFRQRRYLKKTELPVELEQRVKAIDNGNEDEGPTVPKPESMSRDTEHKGQETKKEMSFLQQLKDKFTKSQSYQLDKNTFSYASSLYSLGITVGMMVTGYMPWAWVQATSVAAAIGFTSEIAVSCVFVVGTSLADALVGIPLSLYSTFVLEAKHGFNQTTGKTFVLDIVKGFFVNNLISLPLIAAIIKLVQWGGEYFYLYVWLFFVAFSLVMVAVYPTVIMPLFNEFKPLQEGPLKQEINKLAASLEFPLTKLEEVDGSKRSSHSNAYLYGFFKSKKIVLFDTLLRNEKEPHLECTTEEIVAILGHELGHWKMSHTIKGFVVQIVLYLVGFRVFGLFLNDTNVYASFGFHSQPVMIGLSLFQMIMSPLSSVLMLMMNSLIRKHEFEADEFAVKLGKGEDLKTGLLKISLSNLGSFHVDPLYHAFHHSHPSLVERLRAMDMHLKKMN